MLPNRERRFRITRLKGTPNVSLVGYVKARDETEAISKAITEFNVPTELQGRLAASLSTTRTLPRTASPIASKKSRLLDWKYYDDLKRKRDK
jgi:hypothetical protein